MTFRLLFRVFVVVCVGVVGLAVGPVGAQEGGCAELRVGSFVVVPELPVAGEVTSIQVEVENVGSCAAPAFVVQFRQDRFVSVGPAVQVAGLGADASTVVQFDFRFLTPGDFLTVVEVDTENSVLETNESNNLEIFSVLVGPSLPDLLVSDVAVTPDPVVQGQPAELAVTVRNGGNAAAGSFLVQVSPGPSLAPLTIEVPGLAAGASTTVSVTQVYAAAGNVDVVATADSTNTVAEANEFNNSRTEQFTVVAATADLVVSALSITPDPVVQGRLSQIAFTVTNQGNAPAGPFTTRVKPWIFGPELTVEIPSLGAGQSVDRTVNYTFPFAGSFVIEAVADSNQAVSETDEANNTTTLDVVVEPPLPDLEIASVVIVPASPVATVTATAQITVVNSGNDPAASFVVTWRTGVSGPDRSIQVNGLAVGASATVSIDHTYPLPGTADATFTVDSAFNVAEVDETNNTATQQIVVQAAFVDLVVDNLQIIPSPVDTDVPAIGRVTVTNRGNVTAKPFVLTWKPSPFAPDRNKTITGLAAGETRIVDFTHTYNEIGQSIATTATADPNNQIVESNETNNTFSTHVTVNAVGPDLTVVSIDVVQDNIPAAASTANAIQGLPLTYRIKVKNQGNRPAGPFQLEWSPAVPFELITQGPNTLSTQLAGLAAGATTTYDFTYAYPKPGNFRSLAFVDAFNDVTETREANNYRILNTQVAAGSEINITNFTVTPAVGPNLIALSDATANITIKNTGFYPARNFDVSWNPTGPNPNIFNPSQRVEELLPGTSITVHISSNYPLAGDYTSEAIVDTLNTIEEFDETNNTATTNVTVLTGPPPQAAIVSGGFGDAANSFAWSMAAFKGKIYIGTAREVDCVERATLEFYFPKQGNYETSADPELLCPGNMYDLALRAEIWQLDPLTNQTKLVYRSPVVPNPRAPGKNIARDIGYRGMVVHDGALYVGGVTASEYIPELAGGNPPRILRTTDGVNFKPLAGGVATIQSPFGTQTSNGYRAMASVAGRLFVTASGGLLGNGAVVEVVNPSGPAPEFRQVTPASLSVFELEPFEGKLYLGVGTLTSGYEVWRSGDLASGGPVDWKSLVKRGAGRGADITSVVSMEVFKGHLYIGANGWFSTPFPPSELIRIAPNDSWELVVGKSRYVDGRLLTPSSQKGDGFGNIFNTHFWRILEHDGALYVGTNDFSWTARHVPIIGEILSFEYGFDIYGSCDGDNWWKVTGNGFGDGRHNFGARTMAALGDRAFVGSANHIDGTAVWALPAAPQCRASEAGPPDPSSPIDLVAASTQPVRSD